MKAGIWAAVLCAATLPACLGHETVVRVVGGEVHEGRYIAPEAYAAYAEGAWFEAHGREAEAGAAYQRAAREDPDSAELWTRIGALECRQQRGGDSAGFRRAESIDASYAPLWLARARCAQAGQRPREALRLAERAFALDPVDESTSILLAELYDDAGRADASRRLLDGLVARNPLSSAAWRALLDHATRQRDPVARERALDALAALAPRPPGAPEPPADVDAALWRYGLDAARRVALSARVAPGELALRAISAGLPRLALEQAEHVLAADPDDVDARIAELAAGDLAGDRAGVERSLAELARRPAAPSALGAHVMAELLARRVGSDAARAWLDAYRAPAAP